MSSTLVRVSVDAATGLVRQIVKPTNDAELSDPAHSPQGCISTNMAKPAYDAVAPDATHPAPVALLVAIQPAIALLDPIVGAKVSAVIVSQTIAAQDLALGDISLP